MALSTYEELQAAIADWLNRQDLTDQIPDFIKLLEAQVERKLRVRQMVTTATDTLTSGTDFITVPENYLQLNELSLVGAYTTPIEYAPPHELTIIKARNADATGCPRAYTITGDTIQFAPVADQDYTVVMTYVAKLPALGATQATNWLLNQHPDVYLFGSLLQAAPYLKNDERLAFWSDALGAIMEDIRIADERAVKAGSPLKMRFRPYG